MPGVTIKGALAVSVLASTSGEVTNVAASLATSINAGVASGDFVNLDYFGLGSTAPEPPNGVKGILTLRTASVITASGVGSTVFVNGADSTVISNANGAVSIQGGAQGGVFLGGVGLLGAARNITYTNMTPSQELTSQIAILGGNNLVQTATFGTGKYRVDTGAGNDTINILLGNSTINAGTGANQINLGVGSGYILSVGYDTITGAAMNGGSETVDITSGLASINSGTTNFQIHDVSGNPLLVTLGFGVDTITLSGGSATIKGIDTMTTATGTTSIIGGDHATGDLLLLYGGAATVIAGSMNDTIQAMSGNNILTAGAGNDSLIAGTGHDTLHGGTGNSTMVAGTAADTFSFTAGVVGNATINGFKGIDTLQLAGYVASGVGTTAGQAAAGTVLSLTDGTTITLAGIGALNSAQLKFVGTT
ncbi:calcium-binding protein [Acidisphaera sp. L21]|jgi:Ca2+-binding RTX toxin-like protein|uniref:calcium-binding protein n=1 Tax=Acidisphaera sp. L21 TaxID=1641851 RepID=UPI00131CA446|nr:hypothetical protein [Acidisphaera sp. L21]